jgi:Flp pilus assembly protein protease CpaA
MCNLFVIIFNFLIGLAGPLVVFILRLIGESGDLKLITAANVGSMDSSFYSFLQPWECTLQDHQHSNY